MINQIISPEIVAEIFNFDTSRDLRQRKTRKAVELAMIELLQSNDFNSITISELTKVAEINRKTFYNNYESIDDVLTSIEDKLAAYIFSKLPKKITLNNEIEIYNLFLEFSTVAEPYKEMIRRVSRHRGVNALFTNVEHMVTPYIQNSMMQFHIDASVIPFVSKYITSGLTSIYYEWFQNDNLTPEQVSKLAYNLIAASVKPHNYQDI